MPLDPTATLHETRNLLRTGPRAVPCPACKAPAGLSCRGTLRLHLARNGAHHEHLLNLLDAALAQTPTEHTSDPKGHR